MNFKIDKSTYNNNKMIYEKILEDKLSKVSRYGAFCDYRSISGYWGHNPNIHCSMNIETAI